MLSCVVPSPIGIYYRNTYLSSSMNIQKNTQNHYSQTRSPEQSGSFGFMREIANFCYRLIPSEVSSYNSDWMVHFGRGKDGNPELVHRSRAQKGQTVLCSTNSVLRRAGTLPKNFPVVSRRTEVEEITLGVNPSFDSKIGDQWFLKTLTIESKISGTVWRILTGMKHSFKEHETIQRIETLAIGDEMLVSFDGDSQLYSITVQAASREHNGMSTALCSVTYRINDSKGSDSISRQNIEGLMYLPLKSGSKMKFTEKGNAVRELTLHSIKKIQFRPARKQTRN